MVKNPGQTDCKRLREARDGIEERLEMLLAAADRYMVLSQGKPCYGIGVV